MAIDPITAGIDLVSTIGGKLVDRLFPDKITQAKERAAAELAVFQVQGDHEVKAIQAQLSAIIAEANSTDPLTSRARPFFLYVVYIMILMSLPMGILSAFQPTTAMEIAHGMERWLEAIPEPLWMLFGAGYLGYTGGRTLEKIKGVS